MALARAGIQSTGNQIHDVHQPDPDEDGERHGRDQAVLVVEDGAGGVVDEVHDHLDEILQAPGTPAVAFLAAVRKTKKKTRPVKMDQIMEST